MDKRIRGFLIAAAVMVCAVLICMAAGVQPVRVNGGSMEPGIPDGSLAVVVRGRPEVGDVVLYGNGGHDVLHRVIAERDGVLTLKGDANGMPDGKKVPEEEIGGVLLFSVPEAGVLFSTILDPAFLAALACAAVCAAGIATAVLYHKKRKRGWPL